MHQLLTAALVPALLCSSPTETAPSTETTAPPMETAVESVPGPVDTEQPAKLPEDGRGMMTLGGFALAAGLGALTATSVGLALADTSSFDRYDRELYAGLYVLSAVAFTGGGLLTGFGVRRHRRYRSWRAEQSVDVPPQGNAMLASGAVLVGAGGITTLAGIFSYAGISLAYTPNGTPDFPYYLMGIGPAVLATGIPLLVIGKRRQKRFTSWSSNYASTARVSPYVVPLVQRGARPGLSLGLIGRF